MAAMSAQEYYVDYKPNHIEGALVIINEYGSCSCHQQPARECEVWFSLGDLNSVQPNNSVQADSGTGRGGLLGFAGGFWQAPLPKLLRGAV